MWETWARSLGQEDPLEKGMSIHSSILAWKIPWTEEPGRLQSMGLQRVGHDWATKHTLTMQGLQILAQGFKIPYAKQCRQKEKKKKYTLSQRSYKMKS